MAVEKFIRGKVDSAHHDGRYANRKRELHALAEQAFGEQYLASMGMWRMRDRLPHDLVQWHADFLRYHGLVEETDPFFAQQENPLQNAVDNTLKSE